MLINKLLSDPRRWTIGTDARQADKTPTDANDPAAVCWCLAGAVRKCYPDTYHSIYVLIVRHLVSQRLGTSIRVHNDRCSHEQVVALTELLKI